MSVGAMPVQPALTLAASRLAARRGLVLRLHALPQRLLRHGHLCPARWSAAAAVGGGRLYGAVGGTAQAAGGGEVPAATP